MSKSMKIISKGCLYHIVRVKNIDSKFPPIESVPILSEFWEVFPINRPGIPPDFETEFGIDLLPDTNPM